MERMPIGSTRAGLTLKREIINYFKNKIEFDDLGMKEGGEFVPYHKSAEAVARKISDGTYKRGIIICGTGAGSVITAAKFKGVYPVHAFNEYTARMSVAVNNCNCLVLAEWLTPPQHAFKIVEAWLGATFTEGFEPDWQNFLRNCVKEISELELKMFK